jgi:hypothetical protein
MLDSQRWKIHLEEGVMDQSKIDISMLTDAALAEAAWQHRREALHGDRRAFGLAHELERELRRRAGVTQENPPRAIVVTVAKPWWQLWSRRGALDAGQRQMQ